MRTFIQYTLFMLAFVHIGLAQRPCTMRIKLVMDNTSDSPIANQEFTLNFYDPNTKILERTIPCPPTDIFGETTVTFDMKPLLRGIISLPKGSGFNNLEFNYSTCRPQTFRLSQIPVPVSRVPIMSIVDPKLLAKAKKYKEDLDGAMSKIKELTNKDIQNTQKSDSLLSVIEGERRRATAIIDDLENEKAISQKKLSEVNTMLDNAYEQNGMLKTINSKLNKMSIRLFDFACQEFKNKDSFKFSIRLSNYDYTIDTETEPTVQTFKVNLTALTRREGPDGSRERQIRNINNSFDMIFTARYPMKAFDKPIILEFKAHPESENLLVGSNDFVMEIYEYTTNSFLGRSSIPNTNLCEEPVKPSNPNIMAELTTNCQQITFEIADAREEDGDVINLNWIGNPNILENFKLTRASSFQTVTLREGVNYFELEGVNPGTIPAEVSAKIQCHCGNRSGKLLDFNSGKQSRNYITLFNQIVSFGGKIRNTSKKGFVINYNP